MLTNSIFHKHIDNLRNAGDAIVSDLKLCFNYGEPSVTQILNSKIQFRTFSSLIQMSIG